MWNNHCCGNLFISLNQIVVCNSRGFRNFHYMRFVLIEFLSLFFHFVFLVTFSESFQYLQDEKNKKIGNKKLLFSGWKEKPKPHDGNWMKFLNLIWIILKKNSKLYWHTLHWLKYCEHGLLLCVPPFKIRLPNSLNSTDYHSDKTKRKENLFKLYVHLMIHYNPTR